MSSVKRYDLVGEYEHYMGVMADGDYVTFDDYARLERQRDRLAEALRACLLRGSWSDAPFVYTQGCAVLAEVSDE